MLTTGMEPFKTSRKMSVDYGKASFESLLSQSLSEKIKTCNNEVSN